MGHGETTSCLLGVLLLCTLLYILWHLLTGSADRGYCTWRPGPDHRRRVVQFVDDAPAEFFDEGSPDAEPPAAPPSSAAVQSALDFSDVLVPEDQREAATQVVANSEQIQTINERFDAAKRQVTENRLRQGVYDNKERRRLVEALLRRPTCGRRVRSWRTENSDTLRGDPVPKTTSSWGMLRAGHSNPQIDLHPGALGPMSGMQGQWLQAEPMADNAFADLPPP